MPSQWLTYLDDSKAYDKLVEVSKIPQLTIKTVGYKDKNNNFKIVQKEHLGIEPLSESKSNYTDITSTISEISEIIGGVEMSLVIDGQISIPYYTNSSSNNSYSHEICASIDEIAPGILATNSHNNEAYIVINNELSTEQFNSTLKALNITSGDDDPACTCRPLGVSSCIKHN